MPRTDKLTSGAILCVKTILVLLLAFAALAPLVYAVEDADFFWHLRTGEWIWEHRALPQDFLFSLTAPQTLDSSRRVVMTSYWLVQVLYHLLHAAGGLTAIALLRAALMALLVASLFARSARREALAFLGAALLGIIVMRLYYFERPQIFSFVFFSLLLFVLDRLKSAPVGAAFPRAAILALPLLMVVWANCHGAFILGQGVIALYLAVEGLKFIWPSLGPLPRDRYRLLIAAGTAGILAAFANPNTYHVILAVLEPGPARMVNLEYMSTVFFFRTTGNPVIPVFWLLLFLAALSFIIPGRRPDLTKLLLVAGTGLVAFTKIRYMAFFVLSAVPMIGESFSGTTRRMKAGRGLLLATAVGAGLYLLPGDLESLKYYQRATAVDPVLYPEDAADFIRSSGLKGNLYNWWPWGGYLMWRLAPTKVFSDGRHFSPEVSRMVDAIESGNDDAREPTLSRRVIFSRYGIRYAVLPIFDPKSGFVTNSLLGLGTSPDWIPVFTGRNSVVFVEAGSDGRWPVPLSPTAREEFIRGLVQRCDDLIRRFPSFPFPYVARGDLLSWLGRYSEADAAYRNALRMMPFNHLLRERLSALPR